MIIHVFFAAGSGAEKIKSVAPAEKLNPALNPTNTVITVKIQL